MSSSSEVFSDISSYENHLQPSIKVNVRKKNMQDYLDFQNLRKELDIISIPIDNIRQTLALKPQSTTSSKINHALEVLKKYDNKYKIKSSGLSDVTKVIHSSNSSTNVSIKSKPTKSQDMEPASHQPRPRSAQTLGLEGVKSIPSYESHRSVGSISPDKISKNIRERNVPPEVITVDENEGYESDFELSDSESLSGGSHGAEDVDSSNESQPSARPKSALTKRSLPSETESSIHTISDREPSAVENVGLFGNIRLFTFSDSGPEAVKKVDELIVPVHLKDGSSRGKSAPRLIEKSIDESKNKFQRTLEIPIPSNIIGKVNASLEKSSDYESIAESLTNSSDSDDSSIPFRLDIFPIDDVHIAVTDEPKKAPLIVHQKESDEIREYGVPKNRNYAVATEKLLSEGEDIEETNNVDSVGQSNERVSTDDERTSDPSSYELESFFESEVKPKKGSNRQSLRLSREMKGCCVMSDVESRRRSREKTRGNTTKSEHERDETRSTRQISKETSCRVAGPRSERAKLGLRLATRDVGVQTERPGPVYSPGGTGRRGARPPQPILEPLDLAWDFDTEANDGPSATVFPHLNFTPEIIEALANQNPVENALNEVLKHQISLTRHFMASQYKMYQTYCTSVKQLTSRYTPVTLEETKEFIRMHKKMRTGENNQQLN